MTESRRILLNVIATYGRSLYGMLLGLLCGRWAFMALGEIDYGLYGLVGGLTVFIAFFNTVLAGANARFYALSVGAAQVSEDKDAALEESRKWFNTALGVHAVVPIVLVCIGYPIGIYAINNWLNIPLHRSLACVWVFRYVCLSCFVGMVNVPFTAMYNAKQYIAELTLYSFITSTLNVIALGYMVYHPGDWLSSYAAWTCILSVVPQIVICWRASVVFPECKIVFSYMWSIPRLRQLGSYSGWQIFGVFCAMLRTNGMSIVVNKFFGATMNSAQALGNTVQAQCNTLASAMQGAFTPVITQACGAHDFRKMIEFAYRTCKFNLLLFAVFAIPLALELPEVMRLWLGNPPEFSIGLCYFAMLLHMVDCCTVGHMVVVNAMGRVALYQSILSGINILTIPLCILVGLVSRNVYLVFGVVVMMQALNSVGRVVFARVYASMAISEWFLGIMVRSAIIFFAAALTGLCTHLIMRASFLRICITTLGVEIVFIPLVWTVLLSSTERAFVRGKLKQVLHRVL